MFDRGRSVRDQPATMIKVAIVGTNGLAQYIANGIATTTSHQFVMLSRRVRFFFCTKRKLETNKTTA